ncbi:MAG: oligopeptide ABC transporter ATP-binding protein OppD [Gammaproteobacteria bacterium]|nr:oligopeptide ABC transporter ATP-binding protein OppD [Gammaproteobacteria bacterium]
MSAPLLACEDLHVRFQTHAGEVDAVNGVGFEVHAGDCVGIVGESGSGKTQTAMALMGLLADNAVASGSVRFRQEEILNAPAERLNRIRGRRVSMVFQDPMASLTPFMRIGAQLCEVLRQHSGMTRKEAKARALEVLDIVQIPEPHRRFSMYPHQLSGGQRQRVMIAQALLCEPDLLIADEPTTALDLTIQAQILDFLRSLKKRTTIVIITHDLGVVAGLCDRVLVMQAGRIVERGTIEVIFNASEHPYTRTLLADLPRPDKRSQAGPQGLSSEAGARSDALLRVDDLKVHFPTRVQDGLRSRTVPLKAVDGVSFRVAEGETVGIVGESGCGKSTLSRAVLQLIGSTGGRIAWQAEDLSGLSRKAMNERRRDLSVVFQDPLSSLNPRMTIGNIIAEPMRRFHPEMGREDRDAAVLNALRDVGLDRKHRNRYPHEFSGGQCQRVSIARAMILKPRLLVCDEPVSSLDVSTRRQIIELLKDLQEKHGVSIIFISHDLSVVRIVCDRVLVMYLGHFVEIADRNALFESPSHPYTQALISAIPVPDLAAQRQAERIILSGELPSPTAPPSGCVFRTRCPIATDLCSEQEPEFRTLENGARVACHHA